MRLLEFDRVLVPAGRSDLLGGAVEVVSDAADDDRLRSLTFSQGESSSRLPDFAEASRSTAKGVMRPRLDVLAVRDIGLVVGVRSVLLFDKAARRLPTLMWLNRSHRDDTGWYDLSCVASDAEGFAVVYEGGVMRFNPDGILRWHRTRAWDDVLVVAQDGNQTLRFASEVEGHYELDWESGVVRQ